MMRILALIGMLVAGSALAQPITPPYILPTNILPEVRSVAVRSTYAHNALTPQVTRPGTFRNYYQLSASGQVASIEVCYLNVGTASSTETAGPNTLTVSASLETYLTTTTAPFLYTQAGTTLTQFTFNGAATTALAPSGLVCSDELPVAMASNQSFYVRTYASGAGTGAFPNSQGLNSGLLETSNNGTFSTTQSAIGNGSTTVFSGTLSGTNIVLPIVAGTLRMSGGIPTATDNGSGVLAGTGITSGTINYTTGAWALTFTAAPANNALFIATGLGNGTPTPGDETMTASPSDFSTAAYNAGTVPQWLPSVAPSMILGRVATGTTQHAVCVVGDSIVSGAGNGTEDKSYPEYSGNQALGFIRIGQPSELASQFATNASNFRRLKMLTGRCDRVLGNYGTNDIINSMSAATIEANLTTIWARLATMLPHGYADITWAAILPRTLSAASQTPFASNSAWFGSGTVAGGSPSVRNAVNAWICSQVGVKIGAMLDLNTILEGSPATCAGAGDGTWKSLSYTSDGTHLLFTTQSSLIPGQFGAAGTTPAAVFLP